MSSPYARPDGRWRYNPPPNWPAPPAGWTPPPRWEPDASWPPPPVGWAVWLPEQRWAAWLPAGSWPARHPRWTVAAAVLALLFLVGALAGDPEQPEALAAVAPVTTSASPSPSASPTPSPTPSPTASPTPTPTGVAGPAPTTTRAAPRTPAAPYYANCAAVRAAGKAPLRQGQPGYRSGLDGDADGVACEVTPTRPRTVAPPAPPAPEPLGDVYYASCAAARAAGAAPLYRGEPGYRSGLDRDGDGVACE